MKRREFHRITRGEGVLYRVKDHRRLSLLISSSWNVIHLWNGMEQDVNWFSNLIIQMDQSVGGLLTLL